MSVITRQEIIESLKELKDKAKPYPEVEKEILDLQKRLEDPKRYPK